jgi:hypothetical protein
MSEIEEKVISRLHNLAQENKLTNKCLVQIIELAGNYLNLQTISDYAKSNKLSYNGVKNYREVVELFNKKFVIDND